jgi:hypothetical protein
VLNHVERLHASVREAPERPEGIGEALRQADRQIREGQAIERRKRDHQMRAVVVANKLRDLADAIERAWSGLSQERRP